MRLQEICQHVLSKNLMVINTKKRTSEKRKFRFYTYRHTVRAKF